MMHCIPARPLRWPPKPPEVQRFADESICAHGKVWSEVRGGKAEILIGRMIYCMLDI